MGGTSQPTRRGVIVLLVCAPLLILGLTRCGGSTLQDSPPAKPVTAPGGPEVETEAGRDVSIRASAKGAERYEWELEGDGLISATEGEAVIFSPPDHEGTARLNVTAYNKHGASPKTSLIISVLAEASIRLDAVAIPAGWMSGAGQPERFISL